MSKNIELTEEEAKIILSALRRSREYTNYKANQTFGNMDASQVDFSRRYKELLQEPETYNDMFNALFL